MRLEELVAGADDLLFPAGQLDVALLYALAADAMQDYLGDRELSGKIHIPDGPTLLKRGSKLPPLTAKQLASAVDQDFLELRKEPGHLEDARDQISEDQERVWKYFYPRKYAEFLYATNHEGEGKPIDRIFFDIDRGDGKSAEDALTVTRAFVEYLEDDDVAQDITKKMLIKWTGASFHVELLMNGSKPAFFYNNEIFASKNSNPDTVTERAVNHLEDVMDIRVVGTHEKTSGAITIDPSQTPSGKLNRVPLGSLHMADAETVDGISVPLTKDELFDDGVLDMVQSYTPETVVEDMDELKEKL